MIAKKAFVGLSPALEECTLREPSATVARKRHRRGEWEKKAKAMESESPGPDVGCGGVDWKQASVKLSSVVDGNPVWRVSSFLGWK